MISNSNKQALFGKTFSELQTLVKELGMPAFTAKQITEWLYKKGVGEINDMTNISLANRTKLVEKYNIGRTTPTNVQTSTDGTKKYLFTTMGDRFIESAYIPESDRATLCVSSQVGCKMGCLFCMTGKQGFQGQLSTTEILNQIQSLPEFENLTNVVYMGMGEPLDNINEVLKSLEILTSDYGYAWSPKRITVSSIGIIPGLKEFLEKSKCHLAISLHTPFDDERQKLMPIQNVYPIKEVLSVIRNFDFGLQRRVSFEYIMFGGLNDTPRHAKELAKILEGIRCRINLIRFHPIPDTPLKGTDEQTIRNFQDALDAKGITTTIRASRGQDIFAACGLLSTKELIKNKQVDF
jgi:23S rRNA (adenine2503-C2)-methyltransferase